MGRGRGMGRGMGGGAGFAGAPPTATIPAINVEKCVGCGECAKACPFGAIEIKGGKATVNASLCRGCKVCASACPTGAIS